MAQVCATAEAEGSAATAPEGAPTHPPVQADPRPSERYLREAAADELRTWLLVTLRSS